MKFNPFFNSVFLSFFPIERWAFQKHAESSKKFLDTHTDSVEKE